MGIVSFSQHFPEQEENESIRFVCQGECPVADSLLSPSPSSAAAPPPNPSGEHARQKPIRIERWSRRFVQTLIKAVPTSAPQRVAPFSHVRDDRLHARPLFSFSSTLPRSPPRTTQTPRSLVSMKQAPLSVPIRTRLSSCLQQRQHKAQNGKSKIENAAANKGVNFS